MSPEREVILNFLGSARRFADPNAAKPARLMAAAGGLPLPPPQIVSVLFALTFDEDPEVSERARGSLDTLPDRVLEPALEAEIPAELLAFLAEKFRGDERVLEKIALNPATSDETYCFLASLPFAKILDITSRNQMRLMRCPALFETLGENPATSQATIDRILEFLGLMQDKPEEETVGPDEGAEVEMETPDLGELPPELVEEEPEAAQEAAEAVDEKNLFRLVQSLSVIEKVRLARFGNKEARSLLLRDRNRLVATAAIRSPKVTDGEVIAVAQSRNVADDVLRIVANTREWTKNYPVKLALATNPKAPLPAAIKFLNYLTDRDLKAIMRSREVPSPVAQQARRILARKGKS
ncbi:MAG: hypothetical protein ACE5FG_12960 [Myxococcota bacterium]